LCKELQVTSPSTNILIRVDESGDVVFYFDWDSVRNMESASVDGGYRLLRIPAADLNLGSIEKIERKLGGVLLELLAHVTPTFSVYKTAASVIDETVVRVQRDIETEALRGNLDAQNALGMMLIDRARSQLDTSLLDHAENWFLKASEAGHAGAAQFLEQAWPRVKREETELIVNLRESSKE
jgi:hypothetical protein